MRNKISGAILAVGLLVGAPGLVAGASVTGTILYGGVGGRDASDSENIGAIVILDQGDASLTVLGSPAPGIRLSGVAFDSTGALYASTIGAGLPPLTSTLLRVDPDTGALIAVVGPITDGAGGPAIGIADLAVQPGTDLLFGVRAPIDFLCAPGRLYVIDKATGVATLIGPTAARRAGIAFAPGGTLYETAFVPSPPALYTLNPATGGVLTSVPTAAFYPSLAARPTDAALFAGDGIEGLIFTLDPATGAATLLGNTSPTFVGGLTFRTCAISIGGATADPSSLWPPNHDLAGVTIGYTATDNCSAVAPVTCSLAVASSEGDSSDWSVVDDHHVLLRAERAGNGGDRTYTVTIACTDTAGSSTDQAVTVTVPHDQGHG